MAKATLILILLFFSCRKNENNFYQGKVVDENDKPIKNVFVNESYTENHSKTDEDGYFKLNRNSNSLGELIFTKEGYKIDTIRTVWTQHGEKIEYNFIYNDTTIVKLKSVKTH